ncbi:MAG: type IV pilus secretin PilQ [Deltaproteobacteria bacterium]|jgi:type IV pilus assembly protein PilQ|nr:type IV pilus secretin PilQ [Deltaproteobacteria bacterium]
MPQIDQTSKIVRLQNPSAFFTKAIAMIAALLCALALGYVSQAESAVRSADKADYYSKAQGKKKKKLSKLKRGARTNASTARSARYLAQNDLESDLDSELESEMGGGDSAAPAETSSGTDGAGAPATPQMGEDVQITDIQYDSKQAGGTVVITTTSPATYRTREVPGNNQVIIEIANAKLPEKLKRPFNTKDFKQATVSIMAYQEAGSSTARIVLQYRQPRSVDVKQADRVLSIVAGAAKPADPETSTAAAEDSPASVGEGTTSEFESEDAASSDRAEARAEREQETEDLGSTDYDMGSSDTSSSRPQSPSRPTGGGKIMGTSTLDEDRIGAIRFSGRPISIEVRDTPVRDVITLISDQSGANIIMSDDITGSITIKLRQVPWDQALSIIMKTRGLGYVRQDSVLRIAPIRQLQAEAEEARRIIEAQEATLPLRVKVIPVSFASVSLLATQIRSTLQATAQSAGPPGAVPGAQTGRGRIEADPRTSSIIVTDTDDNIKRIEQLVKALDTAPLQVMIEGKIIEAKESMGRNFGINWGYQGQDLGFAGGSLSHSARVSPTLPAANTSVDLRLGTLDFLGDLDAKLALFENESKARIISSPRVITMNAQEATIEQSIQIAVPTTTVTTGAPSQVSFTYKPIPTTLRVRPQITSGGDVLMDVSFRREFQSGADGGAEVPIETRDVRTSVMVKNGQTTVIGGVYQADTTEGESGTPYLRKVPILGWLFKSTTKSSVRNELLVFITPRIINADRTLPKGKSVQ